MLGVRRNLVAAGVAVFGLLLLLFTRAFVALAVAYMVSFATVLLHATFRTPNFKARLAPARDKLFKEAW